MDFPKVAMAGRLSHGLGLKFEDIDYVFCTHLHIDHCGWNTRLVNGRWVPTFPERDNTSSTGANTRSGEERRARAGRSGKEKSGR